MTAVVRKTRAVSEGVTVTAMPLQQPIRRTKPKSQPLRAWAFIARWLAFPVILSVAWGFVNALALLEAKACDWERRQIRTKEMQIQQLQASIALRLSELMVKSYPHQSTKSKPNLLTVKPPERKATLLGRR